ncbi:unknown [Cercopithecine alphaherpesvirus 9]|uniref:Tegument protein VP22 n=1 Tax=Cercopithecine herpesvirus 9 (strain DHV) TaxID=36348 RepID=Q9E206_CHV9D|nr:tegument protein VP22 [Cercopithecine alphaherpesvirus 9]AAG27246.1 unknown [Cercopithecine alphaherpesvirus 9]
MASPDGDRIRRSNAVRRKHMDAQYVNVPYVGKPRNPVPRRSVVVGFPDDSDDSLGYIATVETESPPLFYGDTSGTVDKRHTRMISNNSSDSDDDFEDIDEVIAAFKEARLKHEHVEDAVYENVQHGNAQPRMIQKHNRDVDSPKRAPPGAGAIASGRPLSFSTAPKNTTSAWCGPTPAYNKRVFCEAIRRIAAAQAQRAAEAAWSSNPPRNNAELDRLLAGTVVRITVHEGLNLIQVANDLELGGKPDRKQSTARRKKEIVKDTDDEPVYAQVKINSRGTQPVSGTSRARTRSVSKPDGRK